MAFRPSRKAPQFADLKAILAQTKETEDPLYQVVQEIIERLAIFQFDVTPDVVIGGGGGGGSGSTIETYLTKNDETGTLPNSAQLVARYGLRFDDTVAHQRIIDLDLEYSGDYVSGPTYSDGDIVVGPDNIAYICVKPTNTPPEMWPGVGMASAVGPPGPPGPKGDKGDKGDPGPSAVINAKYWTVDPDPDLNNERALSLLANGYVKSTAGEPSTIAVIPLSEGGTGATNAPNARTNLGLGSMAVQNADNVAITGGTITASNIASTGNISATGYIFTTNYLLVQPPSNPQIYFIDGSTNTRWQIVSGSIGTLFLNSYNADGTGGLVVAQFQKNGNITFVGGVVAGYYVGDGSNLTSLNASALATGIANPARLGTGTANSSTFLRGDGVWAAPGGIPSGLIVLNDGPCPPGWTRVGWDGYFLRVNSSAGSVGGASGHSHGSGSLGVNSHSHGGSVSFSGTTSNAGTHAHSFSVHVTGTTGPGSGSVQTADAGGSFQVLTPPHTHSFGGDGSGTTDGTPDHAHSFSGSGGIPAEAPGIHGSTDAQSNLPPYIDVILCRKD